MAQQYKVHEETTLLPFLFETLKGWSKKTIKQKLQGASVFVNNKVQTKHNFILEEEDIIHIGVISTQYNSALETVKLEILFQDTDIIAINKPAGLLSVGTTKETKRHALALLRSQLSRGKKSSHIKLWPVHRLDRDTSGVLLFATSKEIRETIMDSWGASQKTYLAIVEGKPKIETDTITQALRLDEKEYKMHVGTHPNAKSAITHYKTQQSANNRSLLEVKIETGRQHQIRAHLSWLGNSVVGDERYGTKGHRMGLHALSLHFMHPRKQKSMQIEVDAPSDFYGLIG